MQNLVLLHGALGNQQLFEPLVEQLSPYFTLHHFDFSGHGFEDNFNGSFTIELFVDDLINYLDNNQIPQTAVFGYSMGGYVALTAALDHSQRFNKIMTLATKFDWTAESAKHEANMLDADKIAAKVPQFAQLLQQRFGNQHWRRVLTNTQQMMLQLGAQPVLNSEKLSQLELPVRVSVGDRDNMVGLEETIDAFRSLQQGQLQVLPNTLHPLEKVNTGILSGAICEFIEP